MSRGRLELFTGPMFGGKTSRMFYEIDKARTYGSTEALLIKTTTDTRSKPGKVNNFHQDAMTAFEIPRNEPEAVFQILAEEEQKRWQGSRKFDVIAFDEIQFFAMSLYNVVDELLEMGYDVYGVGLETDFRNQPFGPTLTLLALVKHRSYWHRILPYCNECQRHKERSVAFFTQRLQADGSPAPWHEGTIKAGGVGMYEARCRKCYIVPPGKPLFHEDSTLARYLTNY